MNRIAALLSFSAIALSTLLAVAQNKLPLPGPAFAAKTVIVFNNTHNEAVEQGAVEALKRWGKFTLVDDPDQADITLTFDRKSEHEGSSSQAPDKDGHPSSSYSMTFSSSIQMHAALKGETASFYTASTSSSKKKAGSDCAVDLRQAYLSGPK